jgi:hypothetical protein
VDTAQQKPEEPQRNEAKTPFDPSVVKLGDFTGRYTSPELETSYEFVISNDTLIAHHFRHDDIRLTPAEKDVFNSNAWFMGRVEFIRDKTNRVSGLKVNNGRVRNLLFNRDLAVR